MNRLSLYQKIILNVVAWVMLLLFNFIFIGNYSVEFEIIFHIVITSIYAVVFYLTYFYIVPRLFRKQVISFVLFSIILIGGSMVAKDKVYRFYFESRMPQMGPQMRPQLGPQLGQEPGDMNTLPPRMDGESQMPDQFKPGGEYMPPPPKNRKAMFFNVSGVLLFYSLGFSIRFIKKWQDDEKDKSELEKEKVKTELQFLKNQINPHFLFNSLNSIYSLAISKSDATIDSILKLSSILRYMLYLSENKTVALEDELEVLRDYIELQKLRISKVVDLNFDIIGEAEGFKIEPFILIPLIENAFKYGADNLHESFINIVIEIDDDKLAFKSMNKIVVSKEEYKGGNGIGLKNIQRRLQLLYHQNYVFNYDSDGRIFNVNLEIKLKR